MKAFGQVTRATQRTWLAQLAQAALRQYGIEHAKIRFIAESSSTVFRVDTPGQQYALRINSEPLEQWMRWTEGELLWLMALRRDTALVVPEPIAAPDGTFVQRVSSKTMPEGRFVSLLRWIPGQRIGKHPAPDVARHIGAFMAQLHNHTEQFRLPEEVNRPHTFWDKLRCWQDQQNDTSATLTTEQRALCAIASEQLLSEINDIGTTEDYGLVHADMTLNNCLLRHGQLNVIDFADCRFSSHYYDIAVPLTDFTEYWHASELEYERLQAAFYEGYSYVRPLGKRYESAVSTFMVARAFDVIEWIHLDWLSVTHVPFGPELLSRSLDQIRAYLGDRYSS
jgi:Ser/Thr protein kinase RdoA (MazF antagonist)